jgi:hypothetical protein
VFEIWARRVGQKHSSYERVSIPCDTLEIARDHIVQDLTGMGYLPGGATVTSEGSEQWLYQHLADPKDIAVRFAGTECRLKLSRYSNDRVAIHLVDAANEDPVATATVNIPDEPLLPDQVFIKS